MSSSDVFVCCVADFWEIVAILRTPGAEMDRIEMSGAVVFPFVEHVVKSFPACMAGILAKGPFGDMSGHVQRLMEPHIVVVGFVGGVERAVAEIRVDRALVEVSVVDFLAEVEPEDCAAEGRGVGCGVRGEED